MYYIFQQAPFTVTIDSGALVIMDTHSHLSKTEVIGLLGGEFQEELGTLRIHSAEPCESTSTGMQCEMDPGYCTYFVYSNQKTWSTKLRHTF